MLPARQQVAQSTSLPAPIAGLNARDSLALMRETDAIVLDNWFCTTTSVDLRKGYTSHATFTGNCETVISYNAGSTETFVAVDTTDNAIIDATSGGAISTPVVGGSGPTIQSLTNVRFDYINHSVAGTQYIVLVNGADTILQYNGTTWAQNALTGPTHSDIFTIASYAERIWLAESDFTVWYGGVNAIAGAFTSLDLGALFKEGGSLSNMITYSADTGSLLADFIAFVSTEGEIVVFSGTDPSSASTWSRVAHFRVGRPVTTGNRAWTKFANDAVLLTSDGLMPIATAVMKDRADSSLAVTDRIRKDFNSDVSMFGANFGWSVVLHPEGQKLLINVPAVANDSSYQYVMNTQTKAWSTFGKFASSWDAFCFETTKDTLWWGGNGVLAQADSGLDDDGSAIIFDAKQAFSYFGSLGS
jgi:hypothetical protein